MSFSDAGLAATMDIQSGSACNPNASRKAVHSATCDGSGVGRGSVSADGKAGAESLPAAFLTLSRRERELCMHSLRGLSLEGVAMEMRVSINTAATFKRRAFAKLKISTLKELFHLAFAMAPSAGGNSLIRLLS